MSLPSCNNTKIFKVSEIIFIMNRREFLGKSIAGLVGVLYSNDGNGEEVRVIEEEDRVFGEFRNGYFKEFINNLASGEIAEKYKVKIGEYKSYEDVTDWYLNTIRKNKDVLTSYELKLSKPENDVFNSVTEMIKKMEMLRHLNPEFGEKVSSEDIYECSIIELLLNAYERSLLNSDGLNSPIDLAMVYDSINSSTETTIGKVKKFESEVIPYLGEYLDNAVRD